MENAESNKEAWGSSDHAAEPGNSSPRAFQQQQSDLGAVAAALSGTSGSGIVLEERSTERFGPVLIVKSDQGQVLHVQQAHNFSTNGNLGSETEAERTIREIERQAALVSPAAMAAGSSEQSFATSGKIPSADGSPSASGEFSKSITGSGKSARKSDPSEEGSPALAGKHLVSSGKSTRRSQQDASIDGSAKSFDADMGQRRHSSISLQNTERFGNVLVVRGDEGQALGMFPKPAAVERPSAGPLASDAAQPSQNGIANEGIDFSSRPSLPQQKPGNEDLKADTVVDNNDEEEDGENQPNNLSILRKFSDTAPREELYEFGDFRQMSWLKRTFYSIERDVFNWYGSFLSMVHHGWGFESLITLVLAVGSTCFFCYYRTPEGTPLAARLDFSIIGSALVFPVTFLIAETFRRREGAIQRLASIKAVLCQIELALLTWRWKGPTTDLGQEWEDRAHQTLHHVMNTMTAILRLPTWNTNRHIYTAQGREFKARVIKRERELTRRLGLLFSELHWYVEDLKEKGLPANEASRINQYNSLLQIDFEALAMVKSYRTPNVSRSFVRIMVTVMPIFYGPYFAWVSGSIGSGAQTNPAFAIALTVVTVFVLLGLVRVQRAMEDPFTSQFPGDVIDLVSEQLDTETRLNLIVACARERKRAKAAVAMNAGVT